MGSGNGRERGAAAANPVRGAYIFSHLFALCGTSNSSLPSDLIFVIRNVFHLKV